MATKEAYDFPVERIHLKVPYKGKMLDTDKDIIVRADTSDILGYVSAAVIRKETVTGKKVKKAQKYYKVVEHKELVNQARAAIASLGLTATETTYLADKGAKMFHIFDFPTMTIEPVVGDLVSMRFRLTNSYDLTQMAGFELEAKRLVCLNGATTPHKAFFYMRKHAGAFSIDDTVKNMKTALTMFQTSVLGFYQTLSTTPLRVTAGMDVIQEFIDDKTLPEKYGELVQAVWEDPNKANNIIPVEGTEDFKQVMADPSMDAARTLWSFYNAFTLILTHAVVSVERRMLMEKAVIKKIKEMAK